METDKTAAVTDIGLFAGKIFPYVPSIPSVDASPLAPQRHSLQLSNRGFKRGPLACCGKGEMQFVSIEEELARVRQNTPAVLPEKANSTRNTKTGVVGVVVESHATSAQYHERVIAGIFLYKAAQKDIDIRRVTLNKEDNVWMTMTKSKKVKSEPEQVSSGLH